MFEGLFLGAFSFVVANFMVSGISAGALISQAIVGTLGVFVGMLVVYKTGAIRVTPKFTRFLVGRHVRRGRADARSTSCSAMFDVGGDGPAAQRWPDRDPLLDLSASVWRRSCFLLDFDQADQVIRAGAPEKAAWGIALGLTVTLVWLYLEILRLLSYFNSD